MFGTFNDTVTRALQADGYLPAGFDCLWIGDEFVWDGGFRNDYQPIFYRVVDLTAVDASYCEDGYLHKNTIVKIIALDQDGIYQHVSISTSHHTWIRQCDKNKRELFDLAEEYQHNLEGIQ